MRDMIEFKVSLENDLTKWEDSPVVSLLFVGESLSMKEVKRLAKKKAWQIIYTLTMVDRVRWEINKCGKGNYYDRDEWFEQMESEV